MLNPIRTAVSRKKRRYRQDGFDLDLAYITDRIIAMGYPSENVEQFYRNPMQQVVQFLDSKHKDSYKVYNLCSERAYDPLKFHGRVAHFPFDDHNAPPFEMILPFCKDAAEFLSENEQNVAVVHCKAGKGRTGVMICAYLLYTGEFKSAEEAMKFYGKGRTFNGSGVTIPSQVRYIEYWQQSIFQKEDYKEKPMYLTEVVINSPPTVGQRIIAGLVIFNKGEKVCNRGEFTATVRDNAVRISLENGLQVSGDVRIHILLRPDRFSKERIFHFWLNTFFVDSMVNLPKSVLDKAHKDRHHKLYPESFSVGVNFASELSLPKRGPAGEKMERTSTLGLLKNMWSSRSNIEKRKSGSPARYHSTDSLGLSAAASAQSIASNTTPESTPPQQYLGARGTFGSVGTILSNTTGNVSESATTDSPDSQGSRPVKAEKILDCQEESEEEENVADETDSSVSASPKSKSNSNTALEFRSEPPHSVVVESPAKELTQIATPGLHSPTLEQNTSMRRKSLEAGQTRPESPSPVDKAALVSEESHEHANGDPSAEDMPSPPSASEQINPDANNAILDTQFESRLQVAPSNSEQAEPAAPEMTRESDQAEQNSQSVDLRAEGSMINALSTVLESSRSGLSSKQAWLGEGQDATDSTSTPPELSQINPKSQLTLLKPSV